MESVMWPERGSLGESVGIFFAGALWDGVWSLDTIFTARFALPGVALTTAILTILPYIMYDRIVEQAKVNWQKVGVLAAGCTFGAVMMTWGLGQLIE
jgi:hypothetical protein